MNAKQPKSPPRVQATGVTVYPVYDRRGNVVWVSVPRR